MQVMKERDGRKNRIQKIIADTIKEATPKVNEILEYG
jgi:hypothetical protein